MITTEPDTFEMEAVTAYSLLASEYYEDKHITSRNFDVATNVGVEHMRGMQNTGLILELGAGRGRVGEFLHVHPDRVIQTDGSKTMLELESRESSLLRVQCDARSTPFLSGTFSCIAAFLFDPFNTVDLYHEIARLLLPGGLFLGTLPAFQWGAALRRSLGLPSHKTRFRLRDGTVIVTNSHLLQDAEILERTAAAGLNATVTHLPLPHGVTRISPDIEESARQLGLPIRNFPILQLVIAKKK